ncbi:hypothetical protein OPIT5_04655 [Opitutaceae bacterium TAV5]|nr:hypothetical protein OPIT5_04655 [Opitutaceae bacterium TAV5]
MKIATKTRTLYCAPVWVAALLVAVASCAGIATWYSLAKRANKQESARMERSVKNLRLEVANLQQGYSDQIVENVQTETRKIHESMMTGEEVDRLVSGLRTAWRVVPLSEEANAQYIHRRYQIARGSAPVGIWAELQALFHKLGTMPAVSVDAFDIQTSGDSRKREFSRITLDLSIYVRKTGEPPGSPSPI